MKSLLFLFICFMACILGYLGIVYLIRLWKGCSRSEAEIILHNFINGTPANQLESDAGFQSEIWEKVKKIIGEERYQKLVDISYLGIGAPLYCYGIEGNLPYIAITVDYNNIDEKRILKNALVKTMKQYLIAYRITSNVLPVWKRREDLKKPYLIMYYSRNDQERQTLEMKMTRHL